MIKALEFCFNSTVRELFCASNVKKRPGDEKKNGFMRIFI